MEGGGAIALGALLGVGTGVVIDHYVGISDIASDTGQNVNQGLRNAGVPGWVAETNGLATTFAVANGGPVGILLSELFDDD